MFEIHHVQSVLNPKWDSWNDDIVNIGAVQRSLGLSRDNPVIIGRAQPSTAIIISVMPLVVHI